MEIQTIRMSKWEALRQFRAYRASIKQKFTEEDRGLMRGYKALSKGQVVLDVLDAIQKAGLNDRLEPRLAIVRADAKRVYCFRRRNGGCRFSSTLRTRKTERIDLPRNTFPQWEMTWEKFNKRDLQNAFMAIAPIVPFSLRPKFSLVGYHILFEPHWEKLPHPDPILLKHLGGFLYAVLATWKLTPLEEAVIKGRLV